MSHGIELVCTKCRKKQYFPFGLTELWGVGVDPDTGEIEILCDECMGENDEPEEYGQKIQPTKRRRKHE